MLATWFKIQCKAVDIIGNETNDSSPLKKVGVGFAIVIFRNETVKKTSDIIQLEDRFFLQFKLPKY